MRPNVLLTFDCEDYVNERSIGALRWVLQLLNMHDLKGLFFITGLMAEKLALYPDLVELLNNQVIGYHSSGHSVRPTLVEHADVKNFEQAIQLTLERETRHIDPVTGKLEGEGGLEAVERLFPSQKIRAFRAPGFCWSPPILLAMKTLGIEYDFSTNICESPTYYKGITFYPLPVNELITKNSPNQIQSLLKLNWKSTVVLYTHPNHLVNSIRWDSIYYKGNPLSLKTVPPRERSQAKTMLRKWEFIIKQVGSLSKKQLIDAKPELKNGVKYKLTQQNISPEYHRSVKWLHYFGYNPQNIRSHFNDFFS